MSPTARRAHLLDDFHTMGWLADLVCWRWPEWRSRWSPTRPYDQERGR